MQVLKVLFFFGLIFYLTINITAQEQKYVTYKPFIFHSVDSSQVIGACMILTNEIETIGKIADNFGQCAFDSIKPGKYYRKISTVEYITYLDTIIINAHDDYYSDTTFLKRKSEVRYLPTPSMPEIPLEKVVIGYIFSGYILSKVDSLPFKGAVLKIEDTKLGALPDSNGYFIIKNLQQGKYHFTIKSLDYKAIADSIIIGNMNIVDTFYLERIIKYITPIEDIIQNSINISCSPLILTGKSYFVAFRNTADSTNIKSIINCSFMETKLTGNGRYYFESLKDIKYKFTIQLPQYNFPTVYETIDIANVKDYKTQTFYFDDIDTASIIVNFEIVE